jgi:hypothetical protein
MRGYATGLFITSPFLMDFDRYYPLLGTAKVKP